MKDQTSKKIKIIKTSIGKIKVTLEQAKEWDMEDYWRLYWVCDTFGVSAHQLSTIEKIEKALGDLLDYEACNQEQGSILEQHAYVHNYNG